MDHLSLSVTVCCALAGLYLLLGRKKDRHLPPGPAGRWLIGNLYDIPLKFAWLEFSRWRETYGDLVYANTLGQSFIILNSLDAVNDFLEKRSDNNSDRPSFRMAGELIGMQEFSAFMAYGPTWRYHRKLARIALGADAVKKYTTVQDQYIHMLLLSLLDRPGDFYNEVRMAIARIMIAIAYGTSCEDTDQLVKDSGEAFDVLMDACQPGRFFVDIISALKYVPSWIPGAPRQYAAKARAQFQSVMHKSFESVRSNMSCGSFNTSFTSELLLKLQNENPENSSNNVNHLIKWAGAELFMAGSETSHSVILIFILAMAQNVDVQKKAQAEVDSTVPDWRLPKIEDFDKLSYTAAVMKETLRWQPVAPLGMARQSREADIYKGMYIPPKSTIFANTWEISRQECGSFPPDAFVPERFLMTEAEHMPEDPNDYAFGFGKRHCPGKKLGLNTVRLAAMSLLATFDILPVADEASGSAIPNPDFVSGLTVHPKPFAVQFKVRSNKISQMIRDASASPVS